MTAPTVQPPSPAALAAEQAARWLDDSPLFCDTETTGVHTAAEVIDFALLDTGGNILLNSLVAPRYPIPAEAYAIHGISMADVAGARTWPDLLPEIIRLVHGRRVITYNANFDERMCRQSSANWGILTRLHCTWLDAMDLYARYHGEWVHRRRSWAWQKLNEAAYQCRLPESGPSHRALADANTCRLIVQHMARHARPAAPPAPAPTPPLALF